ncbi:hypothetical protein DFH08DRAFT_827870 [Mycena albidolilacea]|uniref:Uncharacterized protein n=1 Tax=Mycena albidolilacea TaxID=1033008 RepID=A0AAD6YXE2_9AGAR|nr:hypothetical protein DFH08DRAFT_827870 [Mycena albidolilacea]
MAPLPWHFRGTGSLPITSGYHWGGMPRKFRRVLENAQGRLSSAADAESTDDIEGDAEVDGNVEEPSEEAETSGRSKQIRKPNALYAGWRRHFDEDSSEDEGDV